VARFGQSATSQLPHEPFLKSPPSQVARGTLKEFVHEENERNAPPCPTLRAFDSERFKGLIKVLFEQEGFMVQDADAGKPDGIDLVVTHHTVAFGVQCRFWAQIIGQEEVQAFVDALHRHHLSNGFLITLDGYTEEAIALGRASQLDLMDEPMLMQNLETVGWLFNSAFAPLWNDETRNCPRCGSETILRVAVKPEYGGREIWGCSTFPRCDFKLQKG
jgi:restriction system protein